MTDFKISIIVPVYNVERYLNQCIDSILAQDYSFFEVILVNDGSSDSSEHICDKYQLQDSRIKVIHQKNAGPSAARNAGIGHATGDYLYFMDSDDYIHPQLLSTCIPYINDYNPNIIQFSFCRVNHNGEMLSELILKTEHLHKDLRKYGRKHEFKPYTWIYLIKRSIVSQNDILFSTNLHLAEDAEFILKCMFFSQNLQTIPRVLYYYRQRENSIMTQGDSYEKALLHLHLAEQLTRFFYEQKGENFSFFLNKRIYKLVKIYINRLSGLKYDKATIDRARQDMDHFKEVCKLMPNSVHKGILFRLVNINLRFFILYKKMTRSISE